MKILFVWTGVTSYMADCWRELASRPGVDLKTVVEKHASGAEFDAEKLFSGLDCTVVEPGGICDFGGWKPDVLFAVGWRSRTVRTAVLSQNFRQVPKICCFDMPWRTSLRCFAARFVLHRYLRNFAAAFVPGESAARYARWLGFRTVSKGLFSLDVSRFSGRRGDSGFLYIGRDAPEKRLDLLRAAHERYRELGGKWKLEIYGGGRFVQPCDVPAVYAENACLVLTSAFDPWPLVILEATAAGLAVVASDRCGNARELGARVFPFGDAEAAARAMLDAERGAVKPAGPERAARYDCAKWADRVLRIASAPGEEAAT